MGGMIVLRERLSKNLKQIGDENHWTQEAAAELCDLSPRFWRKLEQGRAAASVDTLEKLSAGLNLCVEDLFRDAEP